MTNFPDEIWIDPRSLFASELSKTIKHDRQQRYIHESKVAELEQQLKECLDNLLIRNAELDDALGKVPISCGGTMEERPMKELCQTQNPIGLHRNIKSFEKIIQNHDDLPLSGRQHCLEIAGEALRWNKAQAEKSLKRRKRAPEMVGSEEGD